MSLSIKLYALTMIILEEGKLFLKLHQIMELRENSDLYKTEAL